MIKRILILCILLAVTAYLIVAVTVFNRKPENQVCKGMELVVKDSIDYGFITETEVKNLLKQKNLYPEKNVSAQSMSACWKKLFPDTPLSVRQNATLHPEEKSGSRSISAFRFSES